MLASKETDEDFTCDIPLLKPELELSNQSRALDLRREGEKDSDWLDQGPPKCCTLKMGAQSLGSLWWRPRTRYCNQLRKIRKWRRKIGKVESSQDVDQSVVG